MISKRPRVFITKSTTNQYFWLFFDAAQRARPFQYKIQAITINARKNVGTGRESKNLATINDWAEKSYTIYTKPHNAFCQKKRAGE